MPLEQLNPNDSGACVSCDISSHAVIYRKVYNQFCLTPSCTGVRTEYVNVLSVENGSPQLISTNNISLLITVSVLCLVSVTVMS